MTVFVFAARTIELFSLLPHRACPGLTHPPGLSIRGRCWQFSPDHGNARSRYSNAAPADVRLFEWREQSQMERPLRASFTKGNSLACVSKLSATTKSQTRSPQPLETRYCNSFMCWLSLEKEKLLLASFCLLNFQVRVVVSEMCHYHFGITVCAPFFYVKSLQQNCTTTSNTRLIHSNTIAILPLSEY